jgi:hypothetical protein
MPAIRDSVWAATALATGTTLVLPTPVHVAGDVLLAVFMADTGAGTWTSAGWAHAPGSPSANTSQLVCMWKLAGASEPATHTFTSTVAESYNGVMMSIQDAHPTAPFGSPTVVNFATQVAAAKFAMQSITTNVANALVIYASANSGLGVPSFLEGPVFGLVAADGVAESIGVGWGFKAAAGATPATVVCSNVATGAGVRLVLQIAPPASGAAVIPAFCANDDSIYLNPLNGTTAYNGDTAFAATADVNFGTTLGGFTAADATIAAAQDAGINSFHSVARLTTVSGSQNLSGAELVFAVANRPNLTGKNLLCHVGPSTEGQTQRFSTVASGRGIWMGVRNAAGNNKIWQVYGRELGALRQQPIVVNTAAANTKHSAGTVNATAIQAVGFWVAGTGILTTIWDVCSLWALGTTTICGGNAASPITVVGIVAAAAEGKERRSVLRQGSRQMLSYQAIQLGNGSDPLYVDLGESAIEFPRQYNAALKAVTYNSVDDVCGITFWPAAGQTVDLSNAVFSSPSKYHWRWHASSSAAAIINTAGLQVIGAGDCQLRALPFTRVTFSNCPTIFQNGATLSLCNFSNSTLTSNNPGLISGCSFAQGASGGPAVVITQGGSFAFAGNQFSGYGAGFVVAADDFNRADGPLGSNWSVPLGACSIVSNAANVSADAVIRWEGGAFPENQQAEATVGPGTNFGGAVRLQPGGQGYLAGKVGATEIDIYRHNGGGSYTTLLTVTGLNMADGDKVGLRIIGTTIRALVNGAPVGGEVVDATYITGQPGAYGSIGDALAWSAEEVVGPNAPAVHNKSGGAVTLNISGGGNTPTVTNSAGSTTTINNTISLTLSGLQTGSDIVILAAGTTTVVHQVDAHTGTSYNYTYSSAIAVDIGILRQGFVPLYVRNYSLGTTDASLPIAQLPDRNYL